MHRCDPGNSLDLMSYSYIYIKAIRALYSNMEKMAYLITVHFQQIIFKNTLK